MPANETVIPSDFEVADVAQARTSTLRHWAGGAFASEYLRRHAPFATVVLGYWAVAQVVLPSDLRIGWVSVRVAFSILGYYAFATAMFYACRIALSGDGAARRLAKFDVWRTYFHQVWSPERIIGGATVFLLTPLMMGPFSSWKDAIPRLNPFAWDTRFAELDSVLHFGVDPWRITHLLFGSDLAIRLIDFAYFPGWNASVFLAFTFLAWGPWTELRSRFLLAFALCWTALGSGLATWLSSAGPCFYEGITGSERFAPLMARLTTAGQGHDLMSLQVQELLWSTYQARETGVLTGISAMPSLHVAMAALIAITCFRIHRILGVLTASFAMVILLGSVHLGFHYAIDGYVSILLVCVIWKFSGFITSGLSRGDAESSGTLRANTPG